MKLCRYGKNGFEKPGMIDSEGRIRDLSKIVENIGPNELSPRRAHHAGRFPLIPPLLRSHHGQRARR